MAHWYPLSNIVIGAVIVAVLAPIILVKAIREGVLGEIVPPQQMIRLAIFALLLAGAGVASYRCRNTSRLK